jgi:hypothetical protein
LYSSSNGPILDAHQQHHVDELADRGGFGQLHHVFQVDRRFPATAGRRGVGLQRRDQVHDRFLLAGICGLLGLLDLPRQGEDRFHLLDSQEVPQVVEGGEVVRVAHDHGERVALELERQNLVDLRHVLRDELERFRGRLGLLEVGDRQPVAFALGLQQLIFGHQAAVENDPRERLVCRSGLLKQVPELLLVDVAEIDENLTEFAVAAVGAYPSLGLVLGRRRLAALGGRLAGWFGGGLGRARFGRRLDAVAVVDLARGHAFSHRRGTGLGRRHDRLLRRVRVVRGRGGHRQSRRFGYRRTGVGLSNSALIRFFFISSGPSRRTSVIS